MLMFNGFLVRQDDRFIITLKDVSGLVKDATITGYSLYGTLGNVTEHLTSRYTQFDLDVYEGEKRVMALSYKEIGPNQ